MAASVSPGDPLGIPTEAILVGKRDSGATGKQNALTRQSGEEAPMSFSRTARRISLPALLAVVLAAALLAIAPGRATPAGATAGAAPYGRAQPSRPGMCSYHGVVLSLVALVSARWPDEGVWL